MQNMRLNIQPEQANALQHRLHLVRNPKLRLCLGLDLVNSNTISKFDQGQPIGEVHIKDTQIGDDTADTGLAGQGEFALLDDLRVALLVRVLHGHNNLGGGRVGNEVHGTTETLDLAGQHPYIR